MKQAKSYKVAYERDAESGWWVATARGLQGCHTQGRTISQARERIREAIALVLDLSEDSYTGAIVDDVRVTPAIRRKLMLHKRTAERAEKLAKEAQAASREAVKALREGGLSTSDAGELLGISKQRAHQLSR